MGDSGEAEALTVWNVLFAATSVVIAACLSKVLGLDIGRTILVAGARCWIQLSLVGYILSDVFQSRNPWLVALLTLILVMLGTFEAVFQRTKRTYDGIYLVVLASLTISLVIALLGVRFAINTKPGTSWWNPVQLIPSVNAMSVVGLISIPG